VWALEQFNPYMYSKKFWQLVRQVAAE
jgi:hypothetical protein